MPSPSTRTSVAGCAWAVLATGLAVLVRAAVEPILGDVGHFIPFYLSVALVAALLGWRAGLAALTLGGLAGFFLFIYWPGRFDGSELQDFALVFFYLFVGGTIVALAEWGRRQRDDARRRFEEHDGRLKLFDLANVLMIDLDHRVLRWTAGCQQLYGYTAQEAVGRVSHELLQTRFPESLDQIHAKLNAHGRWSGELRHTTANGRTLVIASEWVLHRDSTGAPAGILENNTDVTGRVQLESQLRQIEWLLQPNLAEAKTSPVIPAQPYGRVVSPDAPGPILQAVGEPTLQEIATDYMDLLGTSTAIYEKDGRYALGLFSSDWCRFMDLRSRQLCGTDDNAAALASGKWICHESCWHDASRRAMECGAPVDVACRGGLRLYAVPILAGGEVIGSINFGYGDPPHDITQLTELASRYETSAAALQRQAERYETRPPFIVEVAKRRLLTSARLIGEIVERRRVEEELYAVARFPEENPNPVLRIDAAGRTTYTNQSAQRLLEAAVVGAENPLLAALREAAADALQNSRQRETEIECVRGRILSFVFVPLPGKGYVNLYGRDVTAIRQAERALRASEERYRRLFESMDEGFALHEMIFDDVGRPVDYRFLEVNPAFDRLTGLNSAELLGRTVREVLPGVEPSWIETYGRVVATGQPARFEGYLSEKGRWFEVYAYRPAPGRFATVFSDITERKRTETALQRSEDDLNRAQAVAHTGSWRLDVQRNELVWSDESHRIFGIPHGIPLTYETFLSVVHPEDRVLVDDAWQAALRGNVYDIEHRIIVGDTVKWVREKAELEFDAAGVLLGGFGATQDITERKHAEQELAAAKQAAEQAKEAAEAANVAKSQFLANMSHELRTPMNAILGMTESALEEPLAADVRDSLETVKESAESLMELLNEILDLSRIEAGALQLEWAPFSLRELLDKTLRTFRVRAHEKNLSLSRDVPDNVPDALVGDALRVRQIVTNLVSNAIKFTAKGEVAVHVAVAEETPRTICLECTVVDTGIGIAPENLERVFAPFTQADASTTRKFGGTGLGLTICRRLVELMHGAIGVESRQGFGSTFRFHLWLGKDKSAAEDRGGTRTLPAHLAGRPVLVVDDIDGSRRAIEEMLRGWGLLPDAAPDVPLALTKLHQAATADKPFALVVANAAMPNIDGYTLAGWIRNEPRLAGGIILLVPPGDTFAAKRCQELGAGHVEKPVSQTELLAALTKLLDAPALRDKAASMPVRSAPARVLRVLLAEDTPANRKVVARILEKRGHQVEAVDNGHDALERTIHGDYDVVLMDVQMPGTDGFEATGAIRKLPDRKKARVPIIAMTAHALKGDEERCLEAGMDSYIAKPIHAHTLIETVERLGDGKAEEM